MYACAYWHKISGICACAFAEQMKSSIFWCCPIWFLRWNAFVFLYFTSLIESEDLRQEIKHVKPLSCKETTPRLPICYGLIIQQTGQKSSHIIAKCDNVISILQFFTSADTG